MRLTVRDPRRPPASGPGPVLVATALLLCQAPVAHSAEKLTATFDADGLRSLTLSGTDLLRSGRPVLESVTFEETRPGPKGHRQYQFEKWKGEPRTASFDARQRRLLCEYPWGSVEVAYAPAPDRLDLSITLRNTSARTLADFDLSLLEVAFSRAPDGWKKGRGALGSSLDNLALVRAPLGEGELLASNLTMGPPFRFGFGNPRDREGGVYPLTLAGGVPAPEAGAYHVEPHGLPRVPPGKALTLAVTLRHAAADSDAVLADVYEKFRAFHAPRHSWEDRRPIAMLMHSSGFKGHVSRTNPRGWLGKAKLDTTTPAGRAEFRTQMLNAARTAVRVIKETGGQGMILWDAEGQENPHPITYIGDPRMVKRFAPEMDEVADDYFRIFRDAGLRTGACIRPSQVYYDEGKKRWDHGTGSDGGPGRGDHYPRLRPRDLPWWDFYPVAERLCDKIDCARKRWGCTLFYVDSNGVFRKQGEDGKFRWSLLEAAVWKRVRERHPDVLLIPEHVKDDQAYRAATWAFAAPYMEVDLKGYGTPEAVRKLLPGAFSVVNVADGDLDANRAAIRDGVRRGDILLFRGWFPDRRNAWVRNLYAEAKGK